MRWTPRSESKKATVPGAKGLVAFFFFFFFFSRRSGLKLEVYPRVFLLLFPFLFSLSFYLLLSIILFSAGRMGRGHWITAQACLLLAKETATRTTMDLMMLFYPGIGGELNS